MDTDELMFTLRDVLAAAFATADDALAERLIDSQEGERFKQFARVLWAIEQCKREIERRDAKES
jgi:hypothetical protein